MNWEKSASMGWMAKRETRGCPGRRGTKGALAEGGTKARRGRRENAAMLGSAGTRATRDGTASREDPKERRVTSAPWVSRAEMEFLEVLEKSGKMAALAAGALPELRATGVVLASQASRESRAPEVLRAHLVP